MLVITQDNDEFYLIFLRGEWDNLEIDSETDYETYYNDFDDYDDDECYDDDDDKKRRGVLLIFKYEVVGEFLDKEHSPI